MAIGARVGHALGSGRPKAGHRTALVGWAVSLGTQLLVAGSLFLARAHVAAAFVGADPSASAAGDDAASPYRRLVGALVERAIPPLCLALLGDASQAALGASLRAAGGQASGAAVNLVCYYALAIPLAYFLAAKRGWGVAGLATGFGAGTWAQTTGLAGLLFLRLDWPEEARKAQRAQAEGAEADDARSKAGRAKEGEGIEVEEVVQEEEEEEEREERKGLLVRGRGTA